MRGVVLAFVATMTIAVAACSPTGGSDGQAAAPEGQAAVAATAPFDTSMPMKEFMAHVMQHTADGVWKWQGLEVDKTGERSFLPKNNADWEDAESAALTLAQTTNILLLPDRRLPDPAWDRAVVAVRTVALQAAEAAEQHDVAKFEAAGAALDPACDVCHAQFDKSAQQLR